MEEGPEDQVCAWSPLRSQITVHVAKRRTTQTCCQADGPCVCMCKSLMKVKPTSVDLPSIAKIFLRQKCLCLIFQYERILNK